jgi:hypothetical protein
MGAARLRIASFPVIGDGPDAHKWQAPPEPAYQASASHCFGSDTVRAIADGVSPRNSGDHSIARLTWWDHKGSTEWIQASFPKPKKVSRVELYWFDDTGLGFCRVPATWRLLYRAGDSWKPVTGASEYGVAKDRFNRVTFDAITTTALRAEVKLQPEFSGGVLEWKIE